MANRLVNCEECLDNWIALQPIITCFDANGCLNVRCCNPEPLPPPGQPPGYSEICCTRCNCFDGRPIYLPQVQIKQEAQIQLRQPDKNNLNHHPQTFTSTQTQDFPSNCYWCLRLGQVCCCPFAGCCLSAGYSLFSCCLSCCVGFGFCQQCCWSSLSFLAVCHCHYCYYTNIYRRSSQKYCALSTVLCLCCPISSLLSCTRICGYTCKQNIVSFSQIRQLSHSHIDNYKKLFQVQIREPENSLKKFRP